MSGGVNSNKKKTEQLGMNYSTAGGRLVRDLLFGFVKDRPCCHCGQPMKRDNFSIEHLVPWLDSDDPVKMFFDHANIDYAHLRCNVKLARKPHKKYSSIEEKIVGEREMRARWKRDNYDPERRAQKYARNGT